jgi:hypothetical protein
VANRRLFLRLIIKPIQGLWVTEHQLRYIGELLEVLGGGSNPSRPVFKAMPSFIIIIFH